MRRKLYSIIEKDCSNCKISKTYDVIMITVIIVSLAPLFFKTNYPIFYYFDIIPFFVFIIDYLARWITADYKYPNLKVKAFLIYPFTFTAIADMLSILPTISILNPALKVFRISRLFKLFKLFRFTTYSKQLSLLHSVFMKERKVLISVLLIAILYIIITALIMFNLELTSFNTFFDALYWATTALTTVGYGDIYPVTEIGKIISMLSSLFGVAIIALPSGIITAGYLTALKND